MYIPLFNIKIMKKFLFFAAFVACSVLFFSCENKTVDVNESAIARVKAEARGSWEGRQLSLVDEGEWVTVTFSDTKISIVGEEQTTNVNITEWKCIDGVDVWVNLDDKQKSSLHIAVKGDIMTTGGNTNFTMYNIPSELTRKK